MERIGDIKDELGKAVRKARLARGMSQEQLADVSGLDRSYIGGVERGERNVSIVAIDQIADGLRMSISELLIDLRRDGGS